MSTTRDNSNKNSKDQKMTKDEKSKGNYSRVPQQLRLASAPKGHKAKKRKIEEQKDNYPRYSKREPAELLKLARDTTINFIAKQQASGKPLVPIGPKDNKGEASKRMIRISNAQDWVLTAGALSVYISRPYEIDQKKMYPSKLQLGKKRPVTVAKTKTNGDAYVKLPSGGGSYSEIHRIISQKTKDESLLKQYELSTEFFVRSALKEFKEGRNYLDKLLVRLDDRTKEIDNNSPEAALIKEIKEDLISRKSNPFSFLLDTFTFEQAAEETNNKIKIDPYALDSSLAKALLARLRVGSFPEHYDQGTCDYLDALLVLMIGVEGSRNNTTFLVALLHLDLVVAKRINSGTGFPYSFRDFFASDSGAKWENSEHEDYPGHFSMSATATGPGNFSKRSGMLMSPSPKDQYSKKHFNPTGMQKVVSSEPQHHRVMQQEMLIISDWINSQPLEQKEKLIDDECYRKLFEERLIIAYTNIPGQADSSLVRHLTFLPENRDAPFHPEHRYSIAIGERKAVYYERNLNSSKRKDRTKISPLYFHKADIDSKCGIVHEEYVNAKKTSTQIQTLRIKKNINSIFCKIDCSDYKVKSYSSSKVEFNQQISDELKKLVKEPDSYSPFESKIMKIIHTRELNYFSREAKEAVLEEAKRRNEQEKDGFPLKLIESMVQALTIEVDEDKLSSDYIFAENTSEFLKLTNVVEQEGHKVELLKSLVMESLAKCIHDDNSRFILNFNDPEVAPQLAADLESRLFNLTPKMKAQIIGYTLVTEFPGFPNKLTHNVEKELGQELIKFLSSSQAVTFEEKLFGEMDPLSRIEMAIRKRLLNVNIDYNVEISVKIRATTNANKLLDPCPECYRAHKGITNNLLNVLSPFQGVPLSASKQNSKQEEKKKQFIPRFIRESKEDKQNGWACFDIAAGFKRNELVKFALGEKVNKDFPKLLAPEIRAATFISAIAMNIADDNAQRNQEKLSEHLKLLDLIYQFGEGEHQKEINELKNNIVKIIQKSSSKSKMEFVRVGLPGEMVAPIIKELVNNYSKAHEDIRKEVKQINNELKNDPPMKYEEMKSYFADAKNQQDDKQQYYLRFSQVHEKLDTEKKALDDYCQDPETYKKYINLHYGQNKWFIFQPSIGVDYTSMVDIAALFLNSRIIIHQPIPPGEEWREIYSTKNQAQKTIHIEYNGHNHFVKLTPNPAYKTPLDLTAAAEEKKHPANFHKDVIGVKSYSQQDGGDSKASSESSDNKAENTLKEIKSAIRGLVFASQPNRGNLTKKLTKLKGKLTAENKKGIIHFLSGLIKEIENESKLKKLKKALKNCKEEIEKNKKDEDHDKDSAFSKSKKLGSSAKDKQDKKDEHGRGSSPGAGAVGKPVGPIAGQSTSKSDERKIEEHPKNEQQAQTPTSAFNKSASGSGSDGPTLDPKERQHAGDFLEEALQSSIEISAEFSLVEEAERKEHYSIHQIHHLLNKENEEKRIIPKKCILNVIPEQLANPPDYKKGRYARKKIETILPIQMKMISELKSDMACMVSTGLGSQEESHFIVLIIIDKTLLVIDPYGEGVFKHPDMVEQLKNIKEANKDIDNIIVSNNIIQRDKKYENSCGPISVEIAKNIAKIGNKEVRDVLKAAKKVTEEGISCVDITGLLPKTLHGIQTKDTEQYEETLRAIRQSHNNGPGKTFNPSLAQRNLNSRFQVLDDKNDLHKRTKQGDAAIARSLKQTSTLGASSTAPLGRSIGKGIEEKSKKEEEKTEGKEALKKKKKKGNGFPAKHNEPPPSSGANGGGASTGGSSQYSGIAGESNSQPTPGQEVSHNPSEINVQGKGVKKGNQQLNAHQPGNSKDDKENELMAEQELDSLLIHDMEEARNKYSNTTKGNAQLQQDWEKLTLHANESADWDEDGAQSGSSLNVQTEDQEKKKTISILEKLREERWLNLDSAGKNWQNSNKKHANNENNPPSEKQKILNQALADKYGHGDTEEKDAKQLQPKSKLIPQPAVITHEPPSSSALSSSSSSGSILAADASSSAVTDDKRKKLKKSGCKNGDNVQVSEHRKDGEGGPQGRGFGQDPKQSDPQKISNKFTKSGGESESTKDETVAAGEANIVLADEREKKDEQQQDQLFQLAQELTEDHSRKKELAHSVRGGVPEQNTAEYEVKWAHVRAWAVSACCNAITPNKRFSGMGREMALRWAKDRLRAVNNLQKTNQSVMPAMLEKQIQEAFSEIDDSYYHQMIQQFQKQQRVPPTPADRGNFSYAKAITIARGSPLHPPQRPLQTRKPLATPNSEASAGRGKSSGRGGFSPAQ